MWFIYLIQALWVEYDIQLHKIYRMYINMQGIINVACAICDIVL